MLSVLLGSPRLGVSPDGRAGSVAEGSGDAGSA